MIVAKATVARRRNDYGEFVVRAYDADGNRLRDCDYHTDDKDDADSTARLMVAPEQAAGATWQGSAASR